ncbi:hypothetical protein HDU76_003140 [Blyttiomyces sp. JEL0837]|nr:hypothetical protein HDU76_003140 [Blyttiomyces sp. JEL0837]
MTYSAERQPPLTKCLCCISLLPGAIAIATYYLIVDIYNAVMLLKTKPSGGGGNDGLVLAAMAISLILCLAHIVGIIGPAMKNKQLVQFYAYMIWVRIFVVILFQGLVFVLVEFSSRQAAVLGVAMLIAIYFAVAYWSFWMDLRDRPENYKLDVSTPNP